MDDGLITVRVIYMRSGWKSEKIIFTIQCESNKKALKDEIALTIAQMVGLIPGGITIFWKDLHHKYIEMESKDFDFGNETYFIMYVLPNIFLKEKETSEKKVELIKTNTPIANKIVNVSTQTLGNANYIDNHYNVADFVVHYGVYCDNCLMTPVVGFRYKCLACADYDLCENCERKHVHPEHLMIRMPNDNCRGLVASLLNNQKRRSSHRSSASYQNSILQMHNAEAIGLGAAINPTTTEINYENSHNSSNGQEKDMKSTKGRREQRHYGNRKMSRRHRNGLWTKFYDVMQNFGEDGINAPIPVSSSVLDVEASTKENTSSVSQSNDNIEKENIKNIDNLNEASECDNALSKNNIKNDALKVAQDALGVAVNQIYSATKAAELVTQFMSDTITEGTITFSPSNDTKEEINQNQEEIQKTDVNREEPVASTSSNDDGDNDVNSNNLKEESVNDEIGNTINAAGEAAVAVYQAFCQIMKISSKMTGMAVNFLEAVGNVNDATSGTSTYNSQNNIANNNSNNNIDTGAKMVNQQLPENGTESSETLGSIDGIENGSLIQQKTNTESKINVDTNGKQNKGQDLVTVEDCYDDNNVDCITSCSASLVNNSDVESISDSFIQLDIDINDEKAVEIKKEEESDEADLLNEVLDLSSENVDQTFIENEEDSVQKTSANINENRRYESTQCYHTDDRINNAVAALIRMGFSNENDYLTHLLESVNGNISYALDIIVASQH